MLDTIEWGNPLQKHLPYLEGDISPLEKHLPKFMSFPFPKNSSKVAREELNELVDYVHDISAHEDILRRYKAYDASIEKVFAQVIIENDLGEKGADLCDKLFDDTIPLLVKLKFHFQRPRPYQLAHYYKLKLFPYESRSADSPSYPSGHAFQAKLICHVLGNHFPHKYEFFEKLSRDIELSRLYLGVHYPSDIDFSLYMAEEILKDKDFKAKYGL